MNAHEYYMRKAEAALEEALTLPKTEAARASALLVVAAKWESAGVQLPVEEEVAPAPIDFETLWNAFCAAYH